MNQIKDKCVCPNLLLLPNYSILLFLESYVVYVISSPREYFIRKSPKFLLI